MSKITEIQKPWSGGPVEGREGVTEHVAGEAEAGSVPLTSSTPRSPTPRNPTAMDSTPRNSTSRNPTPMDSTVASGRLFTACVDGLKGLPEAMDT